MKARFVLALVFAALLGCQASPPANREANNGSSPAPAPAPTSKDTLIACDFGAPRTATNYEVWITSDRTRSIGGVGRAVARRSDSDSCQWHMYGVHMSSRLHDSVVFISHDGKPHVLHFKGQGNWPFDEKSKDYTISVDVSGQTTPFHVRAGANQGGTTHYYFGVDGPPDRKSPVKNPGPEIREVGPAVVADG